MHTKIFLALALVACLVACKKVELKTEYAIRPKEQPKADKADSLVIAGDVIAHSFYADTSKWRVASYADAEAGILTRKEDGVTTKNADFTATHNADSLLVLGPMREYNFMVVVCDRAHGIYAYRNATTIENMPRITVSVTFNPNRNGSYAANPWRMVNPPAPAPAPTAAR